MISSPIYLAVVTADTPFRELFAHQLEGQSGGMLKVIFRVGNGAELLASLQGRLPDVVLIDPQVPVMDGRTTVGYLKTLFPEIVVAALVADGEAVDVGEWSDGPGFHLRIFKYDDLFRTILQIRRAVVGIHVGGSWPEPRPFGRQRLISGNFFNAAALSAST